MTPKHALLCALLLLQGLLSACKKEKDSPPDKSANKVTATIQVANEAPFSYIVTGEAADIRPVIPGSPTYHINAKDPQNRTLFIYLPEVQAAGTYPFTANSLWEKQSRLEYNSNLAAMGIPNIYTTGHASVTSKGSVTVTVFNSRRIEGTFTARAINSAGEEVVITNGSFSGGL